MSSQQRYYRFSEYLKNRFACRVYKITVDAGFGCPNRDGVKGTGGCVYCDNRGFSFNTRNQADSIESQIRKGMEFSVRRYGASKFFIYFQAYTNTYGPVDVLRERYDNIRKFDNIAGLCIGTRPDCVDDEILDLIEKYTRDYEVWIEYGLQSIHNRTLRDINRNHSYGDFLRAVELTRKRNNIMICAHVIIGLPGESPDDIMQTAKELARLRIEGVKIHPLHIVKGTRLNSIYEAGSYRPMSIEEYSKLAAEFLEYTAPETVIQRMTADCPREHLVAPAWINDKNKVLEKIEQVMEQRQSCQGKNYK